MKEQPGVKARRRYTPAERRQLIKAKAIVRRENLPDFIKVLSGAKGDLPVSVSLRTDYAILLLNERSRSVEILCSVDASIRNTIDHTYVSLKERCEGKGYQVKRQFASRDIIAIVYEMSGHNDRANESRSKDESDLEIAYDALLMEALVEDVSDIHIEVRRNRALVKFRKHGELSIMHEWAVGYAKSMATVIYQVFAEEKDVTFNPSVPQDAVVDREIDGRSLRVRLATMPAYPQGFDMVMRLLPTGQSRTLPDLAELGYSSIHVRGFERSTAKPVGVTILAGTTGSGKSTTLSVLISQKIKKSEGRKKVITVENPPEYVIEGATQSPVVLSREGKHGVNPFAAAIKAAMRSDPDILMVGEVRDPHSAELLVHAVQSGHQAFTTIHAPSALGIVSRLRSLQVGNDILGSQDFLSGLIYQALVPVLCQACAIPFSKHQERLGRTREGHALIQRIIRVVPDVDRSDVRFRNTTGCEHCIKGITGRTVVAEVVVPDARMKSYFSEGKDAQAWIDYRQNGGVTALDHGIEKMRQGVCCPYDVEEKLDLLDSQHQILGDTGVENSLNKSSSKSLPSDRNDAPEVLDASRSLDSDGYLSADADKDWLTSGKIDPVDGERSERKDSADVIHAPFGVGRHEEEEF